MNPEPAEQEVSTEAQRQALDVMSAELVNKLNLMIEEQNARVQAFATQYPDAAPPAAATSWEAPQPAPAVYRPAPAPTRSVTPPPAAKQHPEPPQPAAKPHAATPPPIRPKSPAAKAKEENSIGCGPLVVIIAIIVILLRCCS